MRRAVLLALSALLATTATTLAAGPPQKQPSELAAGAPREAAVPTPAPSPLAAVSPAPAVPPPAPLPPAVAGSPPPPTDCCSSLEKTGFKRAPGVPALILTTSPPSRLDSRERQPVRICACDDGASLEIPGLARVRGGVNTQRYNTIKQFAIYPELKNKKDKEKTGGVAVGDGGEKEKNGDVVAVDGERPPPSFLGLPLGKQFVLIGQVNDTFSLKYWTGLELAARMSQAAKAPADALVAPRTRHVELFVVDGGDPLPPSFDASSPPPQYRGVYLVTQHIDPSLIPGTKRAKGEKKKEKENNDGGNGNLKLAPGAFISTYLHGERIDPSFSAFVEMPITNSWAGKNKEWAVKYPDSRDVARAGADGRALLDSVARRYAAVEAAVFSGGRGPASFDSASKIINAKNGSVGVDFPAFERVAHVPTWRDWFLLAEMTKVTKHSYHSATFMHSLGDGSDPRLRFGPAWSMGQGFGTCCGYPVEGFRDGGKNASSLESGFSGGGGTTPTGFLFTLCLVDGRCPSLDGYDRGNGFSPWFVALFFDPSSDSFARGAAARWSELRAGAWSDGEISKMLRERAALLAEPGKRALARWPALAAEAAKAAERVGKGVESKEALVPAVGGAIEGWLLERARWLDGAFAQASSPSRNSPYPLSFA